MRWDVNRALVDPILAVDVDGAPGAFAVTQGLRTSATQDGLYAQGRTTPGEIVTYAKGGQSAHNWGLAVDVARIGEDGKEHWDYGQHPDWTALTEYVDQHPRLHGGWHFPIADNDHIQSVDWIKWRENLITEGRW